jgi:hypothetical protein
MALQIQTPLNTSIGVILPTSYARISVTDNFIGNTIVSSTQFYSSKEAYETGADPLTFIVEGKIVPTVLQFDYNRNIEGGDILGIAHQVWITQLAQWNITAIEDLA